MKFKTGDKVAVKVNASVRLPGVIVRPVRVNLTSGGQCQHHLEGIAGRFGNGIR